MARSRVVIVGLRVAIPILWQKIIDESLKAIVHAPAKSLMKRAPQSYFDTIRIGAADITGLDNWSSRSRNKSAAKSHQIVVVLMKCTCPEQDVRGRDGMIPADLVVGRVRW